MMIYRNSFRKDNRLSLQLVSTPLLTIHSAVQNEKGQCINYTLFIQLFIGIIALPKVIICKDLLNLSEFHYSLPVIVMIGLSWPRRQATNECCLSSQCVYSTRTDPARYPVYPACCAVYWKTVQWESAIFSGIRLPQTTHSI